ncbi:hypothetical protein COCOBI_10-4420 [Coccomyxa sp. Obi]|nr:hypothetical protein COCOBI_10-4420 [Coccomyxa sp. Obi]
MLKCIAYLLLINLSWAQSAVRTAAEAEEQPGSEFTEDVPLLTSFDGHTFQFTGKPGSYYDLISADEHQVTMKLQAGRALNHKGIFIEGLGVQYHQHKIVVNVNAHDVLAVFMDGQELQMREAETKQEHFLGTEEGSELLLAWSLQYPELGNAVELVTDLLRVVIWLTPAQTIDQDGVAQPAYLNFDAQLLAPPHGDMQGIVGEGFARLIGGHREEENGDPELLGMVADYQMASYFEVQRPLATASGGNSRRLLREGPAETAKFPLHARGRSARAARVRTNTKAAIMRRLSDQDVVLRSKKAMHHMSARRAGLGKLAH